MQYFVHVVLMLGDYQGQHPKGEHTWLTTWLTTERGQVKAFMNGAPLTSKSGEDYGVLLEVCCTTQLGKRMIQVSVVFRFSHDHSLRTLI